MKHFAIAFVLALTATVWGGTAMAGGTGMTDDTTGCSAPTSISVVRATGTTLSLAWDGDEDGTYRLCYYPFSSTPGWTFTYLMVSGTDTVVYGLESGSSYVFRVMRICDDGHSEWSPDFIFAMPLCDSTQMVLGFDTTAEEAFHSELGFSNAGYNYGYSQSIIDSQFLTDISSDITYLAIRPTSTFDQTRYLNEDIYLANVTESTLDAGFIRPDANHTFQLVAQGVNMINYILRDGWYYIALDTPFAWDGSSNLLISVVRNDGAFCDNYKLVYGRSTVGNKSRYITSDATSFDPATVSGGHPINIVAEWRIVSCVAPDCTAPMDLTAEADEQSATLSWTPAGIEWDWQMHLWREGTSWDTVCFVKEYPSEVKGLRPGTRYQAAVRALCTGGGQSEWSDMLTFVTLGETEGISEEREGTRCLLYPNPAKTTTTLELQGMSGKVQISVLDMCGRSVATERMECHGTTRKPLDLRRLAPGTYFLQITTPKENMVKKLVVR